MATENLIGKSADGTVAAVKGENTGSGGVGVLGICATGHGVHGQSTTSKGVVGESEGFHGVFGKSRDNVGVAAESQNAEAMNAQSHSALHAAIIAINDANGIGVQGRSGGNVGVFGESNTSRGVHGTSNTHLGVSGDSQRGPGVRGTSVENRGTEGFSTNLEGVVGISKQSTGVLGIGEASGTGVIGQSTSGIGVHGKGGRLAGFFEGDVEVTGDIRLANADCAEDFDLVDGSVVEPGTVMVLSAGGALRPSESAYDRRVAGVVSGAGVYKPALILDREQQRDNRVPIALIGKVYCKAEANEYPIEVGDLLTTSPVAGHAMKATDQSRAFGAVIGKALGPLAAGTGLLPVLIALQ